MKPYLFWIAWAYVIIAIGMVNYKANKIQRDLEHVVTILEERAE